jgi:hypothetical protein
MEQKTIICIDCGCKVIVKKFDGRTKRCEEHQKEFYKNNQKLYHKTYVHVPRDKDKKRYYIRKDNIIDDIEYCRNNWDKIEGCLNCICEKCIQPDEYDKFLIWEKEDQFYEEDYL